MQPRVVTRRSLLRTGGAALLTAGLGGLAGCGGQSDTTATDTEGSPTETASPTGSPTRTPSSTPETGTSWSGPAWARWLPLPGPDRAIPGRDYMVWALELTEFAAHQGALPEDTRRALERTWPPLTLDWQSVPLVVLFRGNHVIRAPFDRDAVIARVAGTDGWAGPTAYGDVSICPREDHGRAIAVGADHVVTARGYGGARPAAETAKAIVDARRGRSARYPGSEPGLAALIEHFERGFIRHWRPRATFGATPQSEPTFDGQAGIGRWARYVDGPTARVRYYVVFEDASAADPAAVRSVVRDRVSRDQAPFAGLVDPTVTASGRLVAVSGTVTRQL